jgi:hypothetical protein
LNITNWEVTAPSATGTPNVIHCGPGWALNGGAGGSVCTATYPYGTPVTLTAPATGGRIRRMVLQLRAYRACYC